MPGPGGIPGCVAWYKANAITGLVDNDPVTTWADSSGNARSITEATNKPLYKTAIVNGKPVVRFDGVNDILSRADALGFSGSPALTIFVVHRWLSGGTDGGIEFGDNAGGTRKVVRIGIGQTSTGFYFNNGLEDFPAAGAAFKVRRYTRVAGGTVDSGTYHEDGVEKTATSSTNPTDTINLDNERFFLGGGYFGGAFFFRNIEIAEVVIYDRVLTANESGLIEDYLTAKYVASSYPVSVPFSAVTKVAINGTNYAVQVDSIQWKHQIYSPSSAAFEVLDPAGNITISERAEVVIYRGSGGHFGGHVAQVTTHVLRDSSGSRRHKVRAVGYRYLAEKRLIRAVYENMLAGDIARDVVEFYLGPESVVVETISVAGPTVTRIEFPYGTTVAAALDQLAELAGDAFWEIAASVIGTTVRRNFNFFDIGDFGSGLTLTKANVSYGGQVERQSPQYRNRQQLAGGGSTGARTEIFLGDGERRSFTVGYPILKKPTVDVNTGAGYVTKTVGIKDVETGKDWYWNEGSPSVVQDAAGTVLANTHKIRIVYEGRTELAIVASDTAEIAANAAIEGSSGIVEAYDRMDWIGGATEGGEIAAAHLAIYVQKAKRFHARYRTTSFIATQIAGGTIAITNILDLPASMVVESVNATILPKANGLDLILSVVDGSALASWQVRLRQDRDLKGQTVNLIDVVV